MPGLRDPNPSRFALHDFLASQVVMLQYLLKAELGCDIVQQ